MRQATLPIEITQIRVNYEDSDNSSKSSSSQRGSGWGGGGNNRLRGRGSGANDDEPVTPAIVSIVLHGVVYFFNEPSEETFRAAVNAASASAATAAEESF